MAGTLRYGMVDRDGEAQAGPPSESPMPAPRPRPLRRRTRRRGRRQSRSSRFGFVQGAVVSRWGEIVGERYAKVSSPESIRFPAGKKSGGALTLLVEGAHAPLMQHLAPLIIERVNRFFGYEAVDRIVFRQGRAAAHGRSRAAARSSAPVPKELGEGLRADRRSRASRLP